MAELPQSEIDQRVFELHNNSTPRYHEASAKLAWERTIAFFKKHLA